MRIRRKGITSNQSCEALGKTGPTILKQLFGRTPMKIGVCFICVEKGLQCENYQIRYRKD